MMFSAGMGIGLMFYGVAEPLAHFTSPPPGTAAPGTPEAFDVAMATTLFHWTLHPWAIYAVVGLAIAYGTFRRGRPQLLSSAFIPLFGRKRAEGGFGKAIDILAIFATLFGSAASLGLGALQIGGGLIAGGFMGHLARSDDVTPANLRRAMVYGATMGAFAVERFSVERFDEIGPAEVTARARQFSDLVHFDFEPERVAG